ncbi:MAG: ABC transporter substrate-binding protein [Calditrichaceae bacterium]
MKNIFIILTLIFILGSCNEPSVTQAIKYFPKGLDPSENFGVDELMIYSQIYEPLVTIDEDNSTVHPHLVKYWKISENNKEYTFYLRENIVFHDGSTLHTDDVKSSFDWFNLKNPKSSLFDLIEEITILDSMSFKINLKQSNSTFLYELTSPIGFVIISKKAIENQANNLSFHPTGTGPYKISSFDEGIKVELKLFDLYWGKGESKIKSINFKYYSDKFNREKSILTNDVDILYMVSGLSIDRLKWQGKVDYLVQKPVSVFYLGFNNQNKVVDNLYLRQAVLKAINIPRLVLNVNRGNAIVAKGPLPPVYLDYNGIFQESFNIREARILLAKAGYPNGLKLKLYFPKVGFVRETIVEMIKSDLAKIGISLEVTMFDTWEEHINAVMSDSAQLFIDGGKSSVIGDAESFLRSFFHSKSEFNTLHYQNARVDAWLDQARLESDPERRQELYKKITEQILEDTPAVFLYHVKPHFAYNREKIKTLPVNPYGIIQYHKIELNN